MIKILLLIVFSSCSSIVNREVLINGKPVVCSYEAYNCPSYRGPYEWKRLRTCEDVKVVWKTCKGDVHDLDRDSDGRPCQKDCSF